MSMVNDHPVPSPPDTGKRYAMIDRRNLRVLSVLHYTHGETADYFWSDVTAVCPRPQPGWLSNAAGTIFGPPPFPPPVDQATADLEMVGKPWSLHFAHALDVLAPHAHTRPQVFLVVTGSVLEVETAATHLTMSSFTIAAGVTHSLRALMDNTLLISTFL